MTIPMRTACRSYRYEDGLHLGLAPGAHDDQHPLLALAEKHLVRQHALLAARDEVKVRAAEAPTLRGGLSLGQCTGQAGGAEILHRDHRIEARKLQAGLHQQLLEERVADLDRGAALLALGPRRRAWRRRSRALDPVATGRGADEEQRIARGGGLAPR